jgi:xylulokinase
MKNEPGAWAKAAALLYPKDYVNYRLTGSMYTDHSDASGSSFYDIRRRDWSPEILERFGIGREKLPAILDSSTATGQVSESASRETGLPAGALVVAGGSDAVTELLAAGVTVETQCKLRLGTSGALSTAAADPGSGAGTYYVWSNTVPGSWMIDINTRSCAGSVRWLRDTFYASLQADPAGFDLIDREAGTVPPGADGLVFHPYLMGEDAPFWDPKLRGSFWGIAAHHGRAQFARAVYEGTAFALRHARGALGDIVKRFKEYLLVGGGAKSPVWRSVVLDVLGVDARLPGEAVSAKGAAMLAGMGAGIFGGPDEARKRCVSAPVTLKFDPRNHERYSALFARYCMMKDAFDGIYGR